MAEGYSWSDARSEGTYRLPRQQYLGFWAALAMFFSIALHVLVFFTLDRVKVAMGYDSEEELQTGPVVMREIESMPEPEPQAAPEETLPPPPDAASLLEDVDLLELVKDQEIDLKPELSEAEYALRLQAPAAEGEPGELAWEISPAVDLETDLPELGRTLDDLPPAAVGQVIVDPGSLMAEEEESLGAFTEELLKRGANGEVAGGSLEGIASLDDLMGLPENVLVSKKTMLPSDLLFEFNSAELRESAKVGLMKLGLLMDRNPELYCWIEGHTDLIGGDAFNLELSRQRAGAVKEYLVQSLRMDASKIMTRGLGKTQPLVTDGDERSQAPNRRVEIKMRKTPLAEESPVVPQPPRESPPRAPEPQAPKAQPAPEPQAPRAQPVPEEQPPAPILVKPRRNPNEQPPAAPPRARAVEEPAPPVAIPRARTIEE